MEYRRVTTREFLRDINSMTEPVDVYTRSKLKGRWIPAESLPASQSISRPSRADVGTPASGGFGVPRPAPKPAMGKAKPRRAPRQ